MFKLSEESSYLMPVNFGAFFEGPPGPATYHDVTSIAINYETDPGILARHIPEGFENTQPVLTVQYCLSRAADWLAGGGYNLILVGTPVAYVHGAERIEGVYVLVIWENRTIPILAGREQTGMPKIFADIEDHRQFGEQIVTNASYSGWTFLRMHFRQTKRMSPEELAVLNKRAGSVNVFGWRYIPNTGRPGAALSHATLFPQDFSYSAAWQGEGQVQWQALDFEQYPVHATVTQALHQLPIKGYRDCLMTEGSIVLRNDLARQLP